MLYRLSYSHHADLTRRGERGNPTIITQNHDASRTDARVRVVGQNEHMASEPKTQPTPADVGEFLDAVTPAKRREDGFVLADIFRRVTGAEPVLWGPTMVGYGSYRYISPSNPRTRGNWPKTGFSPRKAKLSLYGVKDLPEGAALLPRLGKYTEGAGCVYVNKLEDIDLDVLSTLIEIAWSRQDDPEPMRVA